MAGADSSRWVTPNPRTSPWSAPIQTKLRGVSDLFLTRLSIPDLTPTFSTYFGGSGDDSGWGVAVDSAGNPVVAGIYRFQRPPRQRRCVPADCRRESLDALRGEVRRTRISNCSIDLFEGRIPGRFERLRRRRSQGRSSGKRVACRDDVASQTLGRCPEPCRRPMEVARRMDFSRVFSPTLSRLCYATSTGGGSDKDMLEGIDLTARGDVLATGLTFSIDLSMPARAVQPKLSTVMIGGKAVNATFLRSARSAGVPLTASACCP